LITDIVTEVHQVWGPWASQAIRAYNHLPDFPYLEIETTIGPIDVSDFNGKEVTMRFNTSLYTNASWWTDAQVRIHLFSASLASLTIIMFFFF
jgi:hypothetical protein